MADRAERLRKRGSLQSKGRQSIAKDRIYSVPTFLEIGQSLDTHCNKRASVIIYGNKNGGKSIRAGNLDGLVELLAEDETASQPDYVEAFIATHSYFIDSQSFMQRLMERFYDDGDEDKIFNVFKKWLTTYCEDFAEEKGILFNMFLSDLSGKGGLFQARANELRSLFHEQINLYEKKKKQEEDEERAALAQQSGAENDVLKLISGLDDETWDPMDVAKELTYLEYLQYREISLREFLQLAWSKKDGKQKAKKLTRLIERFNAVSFWCATSILTRDHGSKKRTKMIAFFIQVADACVHLQNYQSAMQIYSALNFTPVERLESEWKGLSKKSKQMYDDLKALFESSGNFKKYRERLANTKPPGIPLLTLILSDLTMIEENETFKKNDGGESGEGEKEGFSEASDVLVHFEKMSMIYNTLSVLKRCLSVSFEPSSIEDSKAKKGKSREDLVRMITELPRLSEKELYDLKNDTKKKVQDLRKAFKTAVKNK